MKLYVYDHCPFCVRAQGRWSHRPASLRRRAKLQSHSVDRALERCGERALVIPRTPDPVYPEFRTQAAREYFRKKKEAAFGPFDALLAATEELKGQLTTGLTELVSLLPDAENHASINDVLLFPILRSLSIVPELTLPSPIKIYRDRMSERADISLIAPSRPI